MSNDSSTGGYIVPAASPPYDASLEDIFQGALSGITGVDGKLVRPRWQAEPPNQPDFDTTWIAFAVSVTDQDVFAYQNHAVTLDDPLGSDKVERDEMLEVFCSFYGPDGHKVMAQLREGLQIEQNRYVLAQSYVQFREFGQPVYLPALLKERNVKRVDVKMKFVRRVHRVYPIRTVTSAELIVDNDQYLTDINITNL